MEVIPNRMNKTVRGIAPFRGFWIDPLWPPARFVDGMEVVDIES